MIPEAFKLRLRAGRSWVVLCLPRDVLEALGNGPVTVFQSSPEAKGPAMELTIEEWHDPMKPTESPDGT